MLLRSPGRRVNFGAGAIGLAHFARSGRLRNAVVVDLFPRLVVVTDGQAQFMGRCVHHRERPPTIPDTL